jgi:hypothetical protein
MQLRSWRVCGVRAQPMSLCAVPCACWRGYAVESHIASCSSICRYVHVCTHTLLCFGEPFGLTQGRCNHAWPRACGVSPILAKLVITFTITPLPCSVIYLHRGSFTVRVPTDVYR